MILLIRNHALQFYDEASRKIVASKYMLENPDAVPDTVGIAVEHISGDKSLADAIKKIETYRRNGLYTLINILRGKIVTPGM